MDRNSYYGGDATSLNLKDLFSKYNMGEPNEDKYGKSKNWNVDLIPKFLMANGKLVQLLISTGVTKYLEFKSADGSYSMRGEKVQKVPSTPKEAITTSMLGVLEKNRVKNFLTFVSEYDEKVPEKNKGFTCGKTMADVYNYYKLSVNSQCFIGHSMALHQSDTYLTEPCVDTLKRIQLYFTSLSRYGNSPYLYPLYGLAELPQGFARLSAVYGGTYMLNKPIEKIEVNGDVVEVTSQGEKVIGKKVVGDPSYFPNMVEDNGQVIRAICILQKPIPNTNNNSSCQIIVPPVDTERLQDIYILCVSSPHNICDKGNYIAIVSKTLEEGKPPEEQIEYGLGLLGKIEEKFVSVSTMKKPKEDREHKDKIFISRSYDASCHFETTCDDILELYEQMFNKKFDFEKAKKEMESHLDTAGATE